MKIFKRAIGILCAVAVLTACLTATMFVSAEDTNIAIAGTAIASSGRNAAKVEHINDGTYANVWQTNATSGSHFGGVVWDSEQTFKDIVLYWSAEEGRSTDYTLEICTNAAHDNWTQVGADIVKDPTKYTASDNADYGGNTYIDTITLNEVAVATGFRFVVAESGRLQFREMVIYEYVGGITPDPTPDPTEGNVAPFGAPELTDSVTRGNVTLENLNDGDKATRTVSTKAPADGDPAYAGVKWDTNYDISKVIVTWYAPTAIGEAGYALQISTDGGATYSDVTASFARDTLTDTITLSAPVTCNAIRIVITAKADTTTGNLSICEFEAIGTPSFTDDGDDDDDSNDQTPGDDDQTTEEEIPTTNIAPLGSAFEDSHRNSNDQSYVNDKKMGEGKKWWQSQKVSDKENADAFVGIEWNKTASFKHMTIYWRDCGKWTVDDYVIQVSTDGGKTWETVEARKSREDLGTQTYDGVECDRVFKDTIVLNEKAEANAVRIYLADGDKTVQMYELEIYGELSGNVQTGVESDTVVWIVLFAAAALICVSSVIIPKRLRSK